MLEFTLSIGLFALLFFAIDFSGALVMAKNRAKIYQHYLLFKNYRQSEGVKVTNAEHPDSHHLDLQEDSQNFSGRAWFNFKFPKTTLYMTYKPHFPKRAKQFLGITAKTHGESNKILRDPWHEHPIRYVLYGIAVGIATGKTISGGGSQVGDLFNSDMGDLLQNLPIPDSFGDLMNLFEGDQSVKNSFTDYFSPEDFSEPILKDPSS